MTLEVDISKAIEANLPKAVVDQLKIFIDQANANEKTLATLTSQLTSFQSANDDLTRLNSELRGLELSQRDQDNRLKLIVERERALDLKEAQIKLEMYETFHNKTLAFVDKVCGHPSIGISRFKETPMADQYGNITNWQSHESEEVTNSKSKS